jgi:DNA-binding NarL/FixJ family response regulator
MDMQMPGMDGLDAAAQLRILDPKVKVIIVTIHDGPELREKCRTMGAHGFVSKNRMHVDLPAEIRRLFGEQTEH